MKMKAILAQCFAALAIFFIHFNSTSFIIIMYAFGPTEGQFYHGIEIHSALMYIGLIIGGVLAQIAGGRIIMMLSGVVLAVGYLSFQWITSELVFIWVAGIVGLTTGMVQGPSYVYLAEISQPNIRSTLMATICMSSFIRSYVDSYLVNMIPLIALTWINFIIKIVGFIMMIFLPNSPYWLANKERYDQVEKSLAWFRGCTTTTNVKSESLEIINSTKNNPRICKLFGHKSLYIPILIIGYVFLIAALTGSDLLMSLVTLRRLPIDLTKDQFNIHLVFSLCSVLAIVAFVVVVAFIGQRILILISLFGGSIALLLACIFGYLNQNDIISAYVYSWLLVICLAIAVFFFYVGTLQVPLLLNGELFPSRLRNVGAGIGLFFMHMAMYGSREFYMQSFWTVSGLFLTFTCVSMFAFISLIWLFPKTENKTLVEIEQSCNSINSLRRKK